MEQLIMILNYVSIVILFVCTLIISTQSVSRMQRLALMICVTTGMCTIGYAIRFVATDVGAFLVGQKLCYFFVTHAMFLVLLFIIEYCRYSISPIIRWACHGINLIMSMIVLTTEYNHLFYKSIEAVYINGQLNFEREYGIAHTITLGLMVLYMLLFIAVIVVFAIKNMRKRNRYVWRILVAAMIPCVAFFVPKLAGLDNDVENIAFAIFAIMLLYMMYRNKLYDVDNIAAEFSFNSMEEAYIVVDNAYHFMGCNQMAMRIIPDLKTVELDSDISSLETPIKDFLQGNTDEYRVDDFIYSVTVRSDTEGKFAQGKVIKLEDVTAQRRYTELLQENKAQIEKDLAMAKSIQVNALPIASHVFSNVDGLNVVAFMETAKDVGGDFYDFYMLDNNRAAFLIADVSGKGVPAAMFMMQAKAIIKNCVEEGLSVNDAFTHANKRLCEGNDALMFVTAWMGILDVTTGIMSFSNAGHNPPIVMRQDGSCEYLKSKVGFVLAGIEGTKYKEQELELKPGDKLYLYTDGVTEATDINNKIYGEERLLSLLQAKTELSVDETLQAVKGDIDDFVGEAEQFDDITMVMLNYVK